MYYRQSILFFGLLLPGILTALLIGGALYAHQTIGDKYNTKNTQYISYKKNEQNVAALEKELSSKREHAVRWKSLFSEETKSQINNHIRNLQEALPSKEFQQTSTDSPITTAGFGSASAQRSAQIRLGFRGTYRALQRAFLELETRMPQLQMQELKIDTGNNQSNLNNAEVSYTAWEN
jgi:hypothetical protein